MLTTPLAPLNRFVTILGPAATTPALCAGDLYNGFGAEQADTKGRYLDKGVGVHKGYYTKPLSKDKCARLCYKDVACRGFAYKSEPACVHYTAKGVQGSMLGNQKGWVFRKRLGRCATSQPTGGGRTTAEAATAATAPPPTAAQTTTAATTTTATTTTTTTATTTTALRDCAYTFGTCTASCESGLARRIEVTREPAAGGAACPVQGDVPDCSPGEGLCPTTTSSTTTETTPRPPPPPT